MNPRSGHAYFALAIALLFAAWTPAPATAASPREAAANSLATQGKLLCHRSFHATGWVNTSFDRGNGKREADQDPSDQFLCGGRSDGYAIVWNNIGVQPVVGPGLNGLSSVQVTTTTSGGTSGAVLFIGGGGLQGSPTGRFGFRFYRKMSNSTACTGRKLVQVGPYITGWPAPPLASGGLTWQGGGDVPGFSTLSFADKWWRWEVYYNSFPDATSIYLVLKNITDNGPEITHTFSGWPLPDIPYVSGTQEWIHEYYGEGTAAGTCTVQWMNLVVAKNLGPGERIPPAAELEGNVPAPVPTVDTIAPTVTITSPVNGSVVKTRLTAAL
jgi:hypothetical protein